jgi:hypothetical protein
MPRARDHYQALGLSRDASTTEVTHALREKLDEARARKEEVTDEYLNSLREAYEVLARPASRAEYDERLSPDLKQKRTAQAAPTEEQGSRKGLYAGIAVVLVMFAAAYKYRSMPVPAPIISRTQIDVGRPTPSDLAQRSMPPEAEQPMQATASGPPLSAEDVFSKVSKSIAQIRATGNDRGAQGSGVVIDSGVVVTNCHVVADASQIAVKVGGEVYDARIKVADREFDLCSLSVDGLTAPAVFVASGEWRVGQRVFAIGSPYGLDLTLSEGLISSLRETSRGNLIQTTAPISPGSSGGGLFNTSGQLIGIVTFQHRSGQNLNFAVPAAWIGEMTTRDSAEGVAGLLR